MTAGQLMTRALQFAHPGTTVAEAMAMMTVGRPSPARDGSRFTRWTDQYRRCREGADHGAGGRGGQPEGLRRRFRLTTATGRRAATCPRTHTGVRRYPVETEVLIRGNHRPARDCRLRLTPRARLDHILEWLHTSVRRCSGRAGGVYPCRSRSARNRTALGPIRHRDLPAAAAMLPQAHHDRRYGQSGRLNPRP